MASSCSFLCCIIEEMQDAIAETGEIAEAKGIAFQDFNFVGLYSFTPTFSIEPV